MRIIQRDNFVHPSLILIDESFEENQFRWVDDAEGNRNEGFCSFSTDLTTNAKTWCTACLNTQNAIALTRQIHAWEEGQIGIDPL